MSAHATPGQIFDLVASLLSDKWPILEVDAVALLESHSCEVLLAHRNRDHAVRVGRWHCPELDLWGAWTTCPPDGIGLTIHLNNTREATPAGSVTLTAYSTLADEFTVHLGTPHIVDRNPRSPRTAWCRNNLAVSIDFYVQEHRGPQIVVTIHPVANYFSGELHQLAHSVEA